MGNDASSPEDDGYPDVYAKFDGVETLGYRVLGVQPDSPASAAGLVSFLDFLVGCDGVMLMGSGEGLEEGDAYDDVDLPALLKDSVGKELELLVHNIKSDSQRLVRITPSTSWGGAGLLGVTIRLDDYGGADERLVRVLSVEHNSPAAVAGLVPMHDYLLGTASESFDSDDALAEVLMVHADRVVELYVYSSESDVVRVVALMPTLSWGGRGLLGAEVGTGYLHRFPKKCRDTDGVSAERRVRMGARPTEAAAASEIAGAGSAGKGGVSAAAAEGGGEADDHTAVTDAASGRAMRFAEQMEMEPEPPAGESGDRSEQSAQGEAYGGQQSAEANAERSDKRSAGGAPAPPELAVPPPPLPPPPAKGRQPLPPPPYGAPHPRQVAASAPDDVDLR